MADSGAQSPHRVAALLNGWRLGKSEADPVLQALSADELNQLAALLTQELNELYAAEGYSAT